jgi:hypothetical protein
MRSHNEDLLIVFGTACNAEKATAKLLKEPAGTFLVRESSVPGLLTISHRAKDKVIHSRIGLQVVGSELQWVPVPQGDNLFKAQEFAKGAKNAFAHVQQHPESFTSLMKLLEGYGYHVQNIMTPEDEREASLGYRYTAQDIVDTMSMFERKDSKGYGSE